MPRMSKIEQKIRQDIQDNQETITCYENEIEVIKQKIDRLVDRKDLLIDLLNETEKTDD